MILSFVLLWTIIETSTIATYIPLFVMIAPILLLIKKLNALRGSVASITSKRVEIIHEMITGIQVSEYCRFRRNSLDKTVYLLR